MLLLLPQPPPPKVAFLDQGTAQGGGGRTEQGHLLCLLEAWLPACGGGALFHPIGCPFKDAGREAAFGCHNSAWNVTLSCAR